MSTEENDRLAIKQFLLDAAYDIKYLVTEHLGVLIRSEFEDLIREFYQGLEVVDSGINSAMIKLGEVPREYLQEHGLTGAELKRKLSIYYRAREVKDQYLRKRKPSGLIRWFVRRFIAAIDVVLDSLAQILPPLGAVKEFKDSLSTVI